VPWRPWWQGRRDKVSSYRIGATKVGRRPRETNDTTQKFSEIRQRLYWSRGKIFGTIFFIRATVAWKYRR
jgi:hypothetical protein